MEHKTKQKLIAFLLCACIMVASVFSLLFVASHAHHDCVGDECVVCNQIGTAKSILNQLKTGTSASANSIALWGFFVLFAVAFVARAVFFSPVKSKIRMNS